MKKIFVMCLLISASGFAKFKNINGEIGAGVSVSNSLYKIEKKSENRAILPLTTLSYKSFYLSGSETGVEVMPTENLVLSAYVDFRDGYAVKGEKMEKGYKTFKDRKTQTAFGGRIGYMFGNLETYISAQGGKRGVTREIGLNYGLPIGEKFLISSGISYTSYSKKFADYYFGVNKKDLGGKLRKEYTPGKASSLGFQINAEYKFTEKFSTFASLETEKFSKEIYNSPVIKNKASVTGGLGIKYNF